MTPTQIDRRIRLVIAGDVSRTQKNSCQNLSANPHFFGPPDLAEGTRLSGNLLTKALHTAFNAVLPRHARSFFKNCLYL